MKKFILFIAFVTFLSTFISCTADELEPVKKPDITTITAKDGDENIPPPIIIKP